MVFSSFLMFFLSSRRSVFFLLCTHDIQYEHINAPQSILRIFTPGGGGVASLPEFNGINVIVMC